MLKNSIVTSPRMALSPHGLVPAWSCITILHTTHAVFELCDRTNKQSDILITILHKSIYKTAAGTDDVRWHEMPSRSLSHVLLKRHVALTAVELSAMIKPVSHM